MRNFTTHLLGLIFLPLRLVISGSLAAAGSGVLAITCGKDTGGVSTTAADDVAFGVDFSPLVFRFCDFAGFFPSSMISSPSNSSFNTTSETSKDSSTVVLMILSSTTVLLEISSVSSVAVGGTAGGS